LTTLNEAVGARGRVALLGELVAKRLPPTKRLAEMIYSCMLCGACKNLCPAGIDIPELIYQGRIELKHSFSKTRLLRKSLKYTITRLDSLLPLLRGCQSLFYKPLHKAGVIGYIPEISKDPFKESTQVFKNKNKIGRVAIFAGCSVNYFYPNIGRALSSILLSRGYEVVVFSGELCCGAPMRSMGLEKETADLAHKNIELFNKVRAEAILSLCPTCTMVIKEQYPLLTGNSIQNIMDVNEFFIEKKIMKNLEISPQTVTYHDPCHLSYGLGVTEQPRQILRDIKGIELKEMKHPDECCGFAGFFSMHFKEIANTIGKKKIENISATSAETVVTSCPGCIMQLESLRRENNKDFRVKHIVEVIAEAMEE
jgi:glycolate oxidase iron-sulfur subunit